MLTFASDRKSKASSAHQGCSKRSAYCGQHAQVSQILHGQQSSVIQREEEPAASVDTDSSPGFTASSARTARCYTNPEFPDFLCLAQALKLDIDENLWNNAHYFYSTAALYPGDDEMMWDTFMRYGLGVNLLQTSFGFLGAGETLGTILSYGTGIGLKSYDFFQNGVLELDVPIPIGPEVNLDLRLDLTADPDNLRNVTSAAAGVGLSGHF